MRTIVLLNMSKINQTMIFEKAAEIFAQGGLRGFSIRLLSKNLGVVPSVLYHHFPSEETLLREMFNYLNTELGKKRSELPPSTNTSEMLKKRIAFQLENATAIVAVLKYYFAFRTTFTQTHDGFLPDKSALHMEEVLQFAKINGEYKHLSLQNDAKVMTHAVNGFILEYYPYTLKESEKTELVNRIHDFLFRALK